ncbi:MAG: SpoIIE family protein phosphatase [Bacteroidetes bacterium]|nr:SpoIIE family protein phosphatase [Bacteroidota bacterium]
MANTILEEIPYHELKGAYHKLEKTNKDLIDGLYYAAFVQQGLMPQERHFRKLMQPYFVYYNPLQIIGGDFFWIGKKEDWCFYAVGDCTGHGVSGAMLSSLAIGFLNYVVYSKNFEKIGDILTEIDKKWIETFNHHQDIDVNNDWMEISLVAYNSKTMQLQFTGAGSNILIIDADNNMRRIKGEHYPIGGWQIETNRRFNTRFVNVLDNEKVFLYSDGFKDQFGGERNKRMGSFKFNQLISSTAYMSCSEQKEYMENKFNIWKSNAEQTDDVCLLRIDL